MFKIITIAIALIIGSTFSVLAMENRGNAPDHHLDLFGDVPSPDHSQQDTQDKQPTNHYKQHYSHHYSHKHHYKHYYRYHFRYHFINY